MNHIVGIVGDASPEELVRYLSTMQAALGVPEQSAWNQVAVSGGVFAATRPETASPLLAGCGVQYQKTEESIAVTDAVLDNRADLLRRWTVPTDSEVQWQDDTLVFQAWQQWNLTCVENLVGDWILGVWNSDSQCLTLIRDHHGNSALFYVQTSRYVAFSSSRQALQALSFVSRQVDDLSVACTLVHLNPPGHRTLFRDIAFVPPAHWAQWQRGTLHTQRYWYPENTPLWRDQTEEPMQKPWWQGSRRLCPRWYRALSIRV